MSFWDQPSKTPLIVGHRGSSAIAPENTITSFRQSILDGADGVELDVHLTSDGEAVVIHDGTLARTTNGSGRVEKKTLAELKQLDAGSWFGRKFKGEQIPTLKEALHILKGKLGVDIELKSTSRMIDIVHRTCDVVKELDLMGEVLLTSFEYRFLEQVKQIEDMIPIGLLYEPSWHVKSGIVIARKIGAQFLILHSRNISTRIISEAHDSNILIGEYPVDTKVRFERSRKNGTDILFSNQPAYLRTLMQ
jgi:glycerophosphoryl diester phosphodiesterase